MNRSLKMMTATAAFAALLTLPAFSIAADEHTGHGAAGEHASHAEEMHGNPLVAEMRHLDEVFREIVSAVAVEDTKRVVDAIETMHGMMEKTQEGLHMGEVKLPRNQDKLEEFKTRDTEFHYGLKRLAKAASQDKRQKMLYLTKKLLDSCVSCHRTFKGQPAR